VASLAAGVALDDACRAAMLDLATLGGVAEGSLIMSLVAVDADGHHAGFTSRDGATYVVRTPAMSTHETLTRTVVA
jgi:hypothetical protein